MRLTEKLHLLKIDFEIELSPAKKLPRFVNVLIIFGDRITLIDTGVKGSEEKIFAYIEENNRKFSEIAAVILSHSHPDHIGSAARIKELTGCDVLAHRDEISWIENIEIQNKERPVPGFFNLVDRSIKVDRSLSGGEILKADSDVTLRIIHSPGHSKGSVNIHFDEDKILFTADSIPLKNDIPNYDDYFALMRSLERIRTSSNYSTLLTSWTPPLTSSLEIKNLIDEGESYMLRLDDAVRTTYTGKESTPLSFCRTVIQQLGLPPFLVSPVVDKAFRSHLRIIS
ncbi:MAG TPA: MBL fold metallo-hydrolase [Candidatus Acidoferrales bacterium]|nr:MBL fold metallo-hydrolase [Candidatus Acidoferrales bacterium]